MFRVDGCWLTPGEQEEAIAKMLEGKILKWDNKRTLSLSNGGCTDIYVNMRNVRSNPKVLGYLAELYANAIRRLRVSRIIEVPEAISPIAGHASVITGMPLVTIRPEEKAGRVVSGKLIGDIFASESVALIDDVITDGASKIPALSEIKHVRAKLAALVVMVDRQQGWKKKLTEAGYGDTAVWSGMTLHDVRKFLVNERLMERCDSGVEEKNPIIVALDGNNWEDMLPLVDQLRTSGCILKVNDLLWSKGIEQLLPDLSVYGRVMADMKGYDIPSTVGNACRRLRKCPPWAVTVHASGGEEMIKAAKKELEGTATKVLAVTVLTSMDSARCEEIYMRTRFDQVMKLAEIAVKAGADGFVCSAEEVKILKGWNRDKLFVVPGVRSPGQDPGDQKCVDTPSNVMALGANHIVMGRQVLKAADPVAEVYRVLKEELSIKI